MFNNVAAFVLLVCAGFVVRQCHGGVNPVFELNTYLVFDDKTDLNGQVKALKGQLNSEQFQDKLTPKAKKIAEELSKLTTADDEGFCGVENLANFRTLMALIRNSDEKSFQGERKNRSMDRLMIAYIEGAWKKCLPLFNHELFTYFRPELYHFHRINNLIFFRRTYWDLDFERTPQIGKVDGLAELLGALEIGAELNSRYSDWWPGSYIKELKSMIEQMRCASDPDSCQDGLDEMKNRKLSAEEIKKELETYLAKPCNALLNNKLVYADILRPLTVLGLAMMDLDPGRKFEEPLKAFQWAAISQACIELHEEDLEKIAERIARV